MKNKGLILGASVILICSALMLAGASRNRRGGPIQSIELTERELQLQAMDRDNSSVRLRLSWNVPSVKDLPRQPFLRAAFDAAKLTELGFDCRVSDESSPAFRVPQTRLVFVALEYGGKAWEEYVRQLEMEQKQGSLIVVRGGASEPGGNLPERARSEGSRLVVVDASSSFEKLRLKYQGPQPYLFVPAIVGARLQSDRDPVTGSITAYRWQGYISELLPSELHVPLPFARDLAGLRPRTAGPPRYTVTLCFGRSHEPWVGGVRLHSQ